MICVSFWKPSGKILFLGCNVVQPLIFVIRWKLMQEGKNFQRKVTFVMFYEALVSLDVNLLKIEQWEKTQKCRSTWISLLCLSSVLNTLWPAVAPPLGMVLATVRQVCCRPVQINKVGLLFSSAVSRWKNCCFQTWGGIFPWFTRQFTTTTRYGKLIQLRI